MMVPLVQNEKRTSGEGNERLLGVNRVLENLSHGADSCRYRVRYGFPLCVELSRNLVEVETVTLGKSIAGLTDIHRGDSM